MNNTIKKCKLSKLFKLLLKDLETNKCDLLVGAGISFDPPSYKPLAKGLICSTISNYLRPAEFNIERQIWIRLLELRPEFFYQMIYEEIGENVFNLLKELKGGIPNFYHYSIVKLIEHGYVNVVFTTNFDTLIEKAAEGKIKLFVVKSNCEAIKWLDTPKYPALIKLHGCITNEDSIRTTLQSVGTGLPNSLTKIIQNRLETQKFLVMGYSGLDHFDIVPALKQISYEKQTYFIQHNSNNSNTAYINPPSKITKESKAFLSCFSKAYFYEGITRDFFHLLISSLNLGIDKSINYETKSTNINHFYCYTDQYIDSLKRGLMLGRLLSIFGNYEICLTIYKQLLKSAKARKDEYNVSVIECDIASLKSEFGKPEEAIKILENVIRNSTDEGLRIPLLLLGNAYLSVGYFERALYVYKHAKKAPGWQNDKKGLALLFNNLGISQDKIGSHVEAIDSFRRAIKTHENLGDVDGVIDSQINLAMVYESISDYKKAQKTLEEVERLANYIQNPKEILVIKGNLGYLYHLTGEINISIDYLCEAIKLSEAIQDYASISRNLANLAQLYEDNHDFRSAFFLRKREIKITKRMCDKASLGIALQNLASHYFQQDRYEKGIKELEKALPLLRSSGDRHTYFLAKLNYAIGLCEIGLVSESIDLSNQILRAARQYSYEDLIAFSYRNKGMCYLRKKILFYAITNTEKAYNLYKSIAHWKDSGLAAQDLSTMYKILGADVTSKRFKRLANNFMKKSGLKMSISSGRFSEKLISTQSKLPEVDSNGYILINNRTY